jgi:hypothetical protein
MINPGAARPLCLLLAVLIAVPSGFAQAPKPPATLPPAPEAAGAPLTIAILEGNNAINSISLLRAVAPVVEIRDPNDFPIEGATVVFTLPGQGPGGTFADGAPSFSTRSDSHGQAAAPLFVPKLAGKFQIKVTAVAGTRKGDVVINQTNSAGEYSGPPLPKKPFYKKRLTLALIGGVVVAGVVVLLVTRSSSSSSNSPSTISVTPGPPVFH